MCQPERVPNLVANTDVKPRNRALSLARMTGMEARSDARAYANKRGTERAGGGGGGFARELVEYTNGRSHEKPAFKLRAGPNRVRVLARAIE